MAEVKIKIEGSGGLENLNENLAQGAKSVNSLKKELRDVTLQLQGLDAGSEEFVKLSEKAGELRDKIKDTSEAINSNAGPAFERLGNQFGLVGSKLATLDFGGAAESMKGLASTIKGFSFKELTDGLKSFGSTIASVGKALLTNPIFLIGAAIAAAYAAISAYQEAQRAKLDAFIQSMDAKIKDYKRQQEIDIASAAGDAEKIYQISRTYREKEISDVQAQIKMLRSANLTRSGLTDEQKKQLEGLNEKYLDLLKEQEVAEINHTNAISAERKKQLDDYNNFIGGVNERYKKSTLSARAFELQQAQEQYRQDIQRLNDTSSANENYQRDLLKVTELFKLQQKEINKKFDQQEADERKRRAEQRAKEEEERIKKERDAYKAPLLLKRELDNTRLQEEQKTADEILKITTTLTDKQIEQGKKLTKEELALVKARETSKLQITMEAVAATNDLFQSVAAGNESMARKAFNINKGVAIAETIISTYKGAQSIFAAAAANPATVLFPAQPYIQAATAIISGMARVNNIRKQQFNAGGGGGGGNGGGGGASSIPSMTQAGVGGGGSTPSFNPLNTSFLQNQQGQQPPLQAFVLSTQVNSTVEAQQRIREQTTL